MTAKLRTSPALLVFLVLAVGLLTAADAQAGPIVLDQYFEPDTSTPTLYVGLGPELHKAQTFTVGAAGKLARVDIFIKALGAGWTGPLILEIRPTIAGVPSTSDASVIASVSIPSADVPSSVDWLEVDFTGTDVPVAAGDQLAISVRSLLPTIATNSYDWAGKGGAEATYAGGASYSRASWIPGWPDWHELTWFDQPIDLGFRTYVETYPIPEPSTLVLLGLGAAGLVWIHRRRTT